MALVIEKDVTKLPSTRSLTRYRLRTVEEVVDTVSAVMHEGHHLLLNTGPLPDGSLDPIDVSVMKEAGRILKERAII